MSGDLNLPHGLTCQRDDRGSPFSSLPSKMCLFAEQSATYKGRLLPAAPRADPYVRVSRIRLLPRVTDGVELPYTSERLCHTSPAQSPVCALLVRIPLGPRPWLHRLRSGRTRFVRRLLAFPTRARATPTVSGRWSTVRPPGSRTGSVHACQVLRPRRVAQALALARLDILPSATQTASAPGISFLSRLNGWPARSPADASPTSSRMPAHGSGSMWFATPSS